jgi:23S rRNA (guanine745-N1)-methyltransferase
VAKQGYVNLMPGGASPGTADTAEMVAARAHFLTAGHYAPLAEALATAAAAASGGPPGVVLVAGAGTGYYLSAVLAVLAALQPAGPDPAAVGLAMDISVRALRRAARADPRIGAIGWDTWQPFPLRPASVSLILNVFAPRNAPEFHRVLRPDGALLVVTPTGAHLAELAGTSAPLTVDDHKDTRLAATLGPYFTPGHRRTLTFPLHLSHEDAATLIAMGPSAHHTTPAATRARLAPLPTPIPVTASFDLTTYHPR